MLLSSPSFFKPPSSLQPHTSSSSSSSPFFNGCIPFLPKKLSNPSLLPPPPSSLSIHAMKKLQGRVVCAASDKTVAVEVVRLAPHPKYKRRIRLKKKYQAHDADNQFKVGDFVQLEKSRPISKTKAFIAIPVVSRRNSKRGEGLPSSTLDLPLQSAQEKPEFQEEA